MQYILLIYDNEHNQLPPDERNKPLAVNMTSVAEIECFGTGVNCSPASVRAL